MPLSRSRDYLSIGEVLESVKEDFPDVSISKIRFLESEGLIAPERTGSGYRKFYEADVARLRYILALQRDQFLPLKVIRERLGKVDSNGGGYPEEAPAKAAAPPATGGRKKGKAAAAPAVVSDVVMTRSELQKAAGLTGPQIDGLVDFGLLAAEREHYDGNDLAVASAAKRLLEFGLEPRHLRMYRQWADREASVFEQIVTPVARRRDPSGGAAAQRTVAELLEVSRQLQEATLRASLRSLL